MKILKFIFKESSEDFIERLAKYYANGEMTEREFNSTKKQITRKNFNKIVYSCNSVELSKQTLIAQENMRRDGRITGYAPIGYNNIIYEDRTPDVLPDENVAECIVALFSLYSTGKYTIQKMVDFSHQLGLTGKISQKLLTRQAIVYILHNPFYCGYARHKGNFYRHCYEKLIDEHLFMQCQRLLINRGIIKADSFIDLGEAA